MQTTAFVGLQLRGVTGAAASFVGFGLPAFLLMLGLSFLYVRYQSLPAVAAAFGGLRALIVALIAHASITFGGSYLKRWRDLTIVAAAAALFWFGLTPILVVAVAASLGIGLSFVLVIVTAPFFARLNALPIFRKAVDGILCSFVGVTADHGCASGSGRSMDHSLRDSVRRRTRGAFASCGFYLGRYFRSSSFASASMMITCLNSCT